jgi:hypothetical protein
MAMIVREKRRSTAALQSSSCEIRGKACQVSRGFRTVTRRRVAFAPIGDIDYSLITGHHSLFANAGVVQW